MKNFYRKTLIAAFLIGSAATAFSQQMPPIPTDPDVRTGKLENGILTGDLYIRGSGDPSFSQTELWQFVRKIQDSGIREIRGDVILDKSVFGIRNYDAAAFDEAPLKPYNAGPNGLLLNEKNRTDLIVKAASDPEYREALYKEYGI